MAYRNRRKYRRTLDKNIVLVSLMEVPGMKELDGHTLTCTTADISVGGIRMISGIKIPVGTIMDLRVAAVSPPTAFKMIGRVSWQLEVLSPHAFFIGVEFITPDESTKMAWYKFVESKLPPPFVPNPGPA